MKELSDIAKKQIETSFIPEYRDEATEEDGLGLALSHHFEYDGLRILKTCFAALEDANFHSECVEIGKMIEKIEGRIEEAA